MLKNVIFYHTIQRFEKKKCLETFIFIGVLYAFAL
ncbi:hypothetical protein SAMN05421736_102202 [Evansella caseinilytica]|uniref:Uncharacterized protein n=1 Tax=Evansella caseinilytica TaxID=1503961 RepID=A0A1H3KPI9_9BACI|nr:hypothetical protein SAMN05421736_102202 [Evansella caseinilytica]